MNFLITEMPFRCSDRMPIILGSRICDASSIIARLNCFKSNRAELLHSDAVVPTITRVFVIRVFNSLTLEHSFDLFSNKNSLYLLSQEFLFPMRLYMIIEVYLSSLQLTLL